MSRVLSGVGERVGEEVRVERGPLGPAQFWRGQSRYVVGELLVLTGGTAAEVGELPEEMSAR